MPPPENIMSKPELPPVDTDQMDRMIEELKAGEQGLDATATDRILIAFKDGSYKKLSNVVTWRHSQWIHFTLPDQSVVMVNPRNVNYMHRGIQDNTGGKST